jgi:hypothetical protein
MAIAYQDFTPTLLQESLLSPAHEDLPAVVARANEWIARFNIQVINVETVAGMKDPALMVDPENVIGHWGYHLIRVWYAV